MKYNAGGEPERMIGLARSMGGFIRMRQEWRDGDSQDSDHDVSFLNAGEGLITQEAGVSERFMFDYLPMSYGATMNVPFPFVLVPGSDGSSAKDDLKKLAARAA